jgi:DNA-binding response OmpR family regulator
MAARILIVDDSPTIRKVVRAILERRDYETIAAGDGQEALATLAWRSVDLILLDFVMPRMNGYQFCRELRADDKLKELPIVLMSAKADKIRGQFVQQTGAIDTITKPFDARGLVAVVEGALDRSKEGRGPPIPDAAVMPLEEPRESLYPHDSHAAVDSVPPSADNAIEAANYLSRVLADQFALTSPGLKDPASVLVGVEQALTARVVSDLKALLKPQTAEPRDVLSGDLSVISIAEVLQMLQMQRQSGALVLTTRKRCVNLFMNEGNLDFASSRGLPQEFLLGRYLVQSKALSRTQLDELLQDEADNELLLGEQLVERGLVSEEQVRSSLVQQTSELLYEVVRWKKGRFRFVTDSADDIAEKAELKLAIGGLIMEGFRRVDEWQLIEGSFDFNEVLFRDPAAISTVRERSPLTSQEQAVLDAINGKRTVREIVDVMGGSSFELCKILYQFLNSRLVRRHAA